MENVKNLGGERAFVVTGGSSMKKYGFLDSLMSYLKEGGMEVYLFDGVEPDPSVQTVIRGAAEMMKFMPDRIVAIGGGSPIDAAKAMWTFYEYPMFHLNRSVSPSIFRPSEKGEILRNIVDLRYCD